MRIGYIVILLLGLHQAVLSAKTTATYKGFGKICIYQPENPPQSFVVFLSGDGGWRAGVDMLATSLMGKDVLVIGIDLKQYLRQARESKEKCFYPAGDIEELAMTLQKRLKLPQYLKPILVGYSAGASIAYGALAQAPANTFKGAILLGFCSDIDINKPLCQGSGLECRTINKDKQLLLKSGSSLSAPVVVLHGMQDRESPISGVKAFFEGQSSATITALPTGHSLLGKKFWIPQLEMALTKLKEARTYAERKVAEAYRMSNTSLNDLPLISVASASKDEDSPLVIFISGDGGWTNFDNSVSEKIAETGFPVVGLDSQKYFWNKQDPRKTAQDIARTAEYYMRHWGKRSFLIVGYSFGACVAPFIAADLPQQQKEQLKGVFMFSPDERGDFEIHLTDMLNIGSDDEYDVPEELKKIKAYKPVCVFGSEEDASLRNKFIAAGVKVTVLPGSHHYDSNYELLAKTIKEHYNSK